MRAAYSNIESKSKLLKPCYDHTNLDKGDQLTNLAQLKYGQTDIPSVVNNQTVAPHIVTDEELEIARN